MDYRVLLLVPVFLTFLVSNQAKRPYTIELSNFTCRLLEPSKAHELTCMLLRKRIIPMLSVRFKLKETVNAFNLIAEIKMVKKDNNKVSLGRHKLDGCKFLTSFYGNNIFGKFFKRIQRNNHIPTKCPVPGNELFEISNYSVLDSEYPPVVPALSHQLVLEVEIEDKIAANIFVAGSVSY